MALKLIKSFPDGFVLVEKDGKQFQLHESDERVKDLKPAPRTAKTLGKMKKDELIEICLNEKITLNGDETKDDIVKLILEAAE